MKYLEVRSTGKKLGTLAVLSAMALPAMFANAPRAQADPPDNAPAHGWRNHHRNDDQNNDDQNNGNTTYNNGYNNDGYNRDGYNRDGRDRDGHDRNWHRSHDADRNNGNNGNNAYPSANNGYYGTANNGYYGNGTNGGYAAGTNVATDFPGTVVSSSRNVLRVAADYNGLTYSVSTSNARSFNAGDRVRTVGYATRDRVQASNVILIARGSGTYNGAYNGNGTWNQGVLGGIFGNNNGYYGNGTNGGYAAGTNVATDFPGTVVSSSRNVLRVAADYNGLTYSVSTSNARSFNAGDRVRTVGYATRDRVQASNVILIARGSGTYNGAYNGNGTWNRSGAYNNANGRPVNFNGTVTGVNGLLGVLNVRGDNGRDYAVRIGNARSFGNGTRVHVTGNWDGAQIVSAGVTPF